MFSSAPLGCGAAFWPIALAIACVASNAHPPAAETPRPVATSPTADEAELGAQVKKLLDQSEVSEADWKQLGPGALPVLESLCKNSRTPPAQRARAVDALAVMDDPNASLKLKALLSDRKLAASYRSRAAAALGQREGSAAAPALKPLLSEASPQLRESAIRTLTNVGGEDARRSLEERLPREEDGQLRELIQRSLAKLQP